MYVRTYVRTSIHTYVSTLCKLINLCIYTVHIHLQLQQLQHIRVFFPCTYLTSTLSTGQYAYPYEVKLREVKLRVVYSYITLSIALFERKLLTLYH